MTGAGVRDYRGLKDIRGYASIAGLKLALDVPGEALETFQTSRDVIRRSREEDVPLGTENVREYRV